MARRKKTGSNLLAPVAGRLVQPLTKSQSKLLDALIDDPRLSPADLCEVAGVPAYTWRRALRSPAFAAALLDAQRSALDASRLSRTQAAIEKAQTSPAFARLCFQIDGSIKDAPSLVQVLNQQVIHMPIAQLRKSFEAGNVVEIPNLNYSEVRSQNKPVLPVENQEFKELKGSTLVNSSSDCDLSHDTQPGNGLVRVNNTPSDHSEVLRSGTRYEVDQYEVRSGAGMKSEVVEVHHSEVRSGTRSEVVTDSEVRCDGQGQAFRVTRAAQEGSATATRYEVDDYDLL